MLAFFPALPALPRTGASGAAAAPIPSRVGPHLGRGVWGRVVLPLFLDTEGGKVAVSTLPGAALAEGRGLYITHTNRSAEVRSAMLSRAWRTGCVSGTGGGMGSGHLGRGAE